MGDFPGHPFRGNQWTDQTISVRGENRKLGDVLGGKLYHGSPYPFQPGDIIEPGHKPNFRESRKQKDVSLTSDQGRAEYWAEKAGRGKKAPGRVYEVVPVGEVSPHSVGLENFGKNIVLFEGRAPKLRVVRVVADDLVPKELR